MRHAITAILMLSLAGAVCAAPWLAEDFEEARRPQDSGWRVEEDGGWIAIRGLGGLQRLSTEFNSREYSTLQVYLRIQHGTGTVWFDEVQISGLQVRNAGFEEAEGNRLVGWAQDDVGETIFWDGQRAIAGRASARITKTQAAGHRRIYQNVACEPNTDYRLEVWARSEDLDGSAYAEVYGIEDSALGANLTHTAHLEGPSPQFGHRALALHPREGVVAQSRPLPGRGDRLATLSAEVNLRQMTGESAVDLSVIDEVSGDTLASATRSTEDEAGGWAPVRMNFRAPADARLRVRVSAEGRGTALVDNVTVGKISLPIPPQRMRLGALSEGVAVGGAAPGVSGADEGLLARGAALVAETLQELPEAAEGPPRAERIEVRVAGEAVAWPEEERYRLTVDSDGIVITAPTERGALWGLMTLLDLAEAGQGMVPACDIEDWPAMPFRGTYRGGIPSDAEDAGRWGRRLARLKMNALVMEWGGWFALDEGDNRQRAEEVFRVLREWGVEPIPELQSLGHAGNQLSRNPNVVEGAWQRDEELVLRGTDPVALEHNNVLRTEATDIVITSADGQTTYQEGRDYEVIEGELSFPYEPDAEPFQVRRIEGGRIADGARVLASYDYAVKMGSGNIPYCPSEPAVYQIMFPALERTISYLQPVYVHIGHDEPRIVNSDSRCLKRDMTGGQLLAEDIRKLNDFAHSIDPDVRLMMWADALNPYHNGTWFRGEHQGELNLVPKDVIQNVWFYGATQPLDRGRQSFEHFHRYGFTVTGSPWDNATCCHNWGVVAGEARRKGLDCMGLLYTSWGSKWAGLETLAAVAWNPPKN
ncbi:MAG: glycoside hydrolase family 20 zincin-like fold domain-containing protein [Armatimonadota bacterium]|nr:glycoside hydrolase family 20 zincin-like fold domain-containing protein [Armatimonadota bacterium]